MVSIDQVELGPWDASVGVDVAGTGSVPDVLLLHSEQGPGSFRALQSSMARVGNPVLPVHPGFGGQPRVNGVDTVRDLAYVYLDLLDRLGVRSCVVVGSSFGAWLALEMAAMDPARFRATCVISPIGVKLGAGNESDFAEVLIENPARIAHTLYHDIDRDIWKDRTATDDVIRRAEEREAWLHYGWEPYLHNPKLRPVLARVRRPVLVISGASDRLVEPGYYGKFAAELDDAPLETVTDAGHYPEIEQPEATIQLVTSFLSGTVSGHQLIPSGAIR
jgi:pimeloyl-ACP methyl ester carboxylesterase